MYDLIRNDPEMAWRIMKIMWKLDSSEKILANIAAGPLEDLLKYHGEKFINRVEESGAERSCFQANARCRLAKHYPGRCLESS
jgi:hypothetical protein